MKRLSTIIPLFIIFSLISAACDVLPDLSTSGIVATTEPDDVTDPALPATEIPFPTNRFTPTPTLTEVGCPNADYPDWETSLYVLPYPVGETYEVRLSNCSSSFHAEGRNDALAFDFAMDVGTLITASRGGVVVFVEESGEGRETNNLVVVDHGDGTFGEYMHLMLDGALVEVDDVVEQGDPIGLSGATGLAGYPHLHLIVVRDSWEWPYIGVPITFSNTTPNPNSLASDTSYTALPYSD